MHKINEDNDYQFSSFDGSTLTVQSQIMQETNIVQFEQTPTYSAENVKVYQKSNAAFTTSFLLLFLVVISLAFSFLILLFL